MESFKINRGRAVIVLAATVFGLSACGGSSNGGTGSPSPGPSLTAEQQRQALAQSAVEFAQEATSSDALFFAADFGGVDDTNFQDPRDGMLMMGLMVRPQQTDEFELCNAGGTFEKVIDETNHVRLVWNNCRTELSEEGISLDSVANGVVESKWSQPSPAGLDYLIETATEAFSVESDFTFDGNRTIIRFAADGATAVEWSSDLEFTAKADSETEFAVTCNGQSLGGKIGFQDVSVAVEPTGIPNEGKLTFDGTYSISDFSPDLNGEYTYETVEPVFFSQFDTDRPYAGVVRVSGNGFNITIQYDEAGLFIDDKFYTWEEFEEDIDDADIDFDFEGCFGL